MKRMMLSVALFVTAFVVILFTVRIYRTERSEASFNGIYIRHSQHEFGSEWDTLSIQRIEETQRYSIIRRWRYERVLDGKSIAPEYKRTQTMGVYLEKEGILLDEDSGLRFQLLSRTNELLVGTTVYQKIKL